jgi:hypothetical protein
MSRCWDECCAPPPDSQDPRVTHIILTNAIVMAPLLIFAIITNVLVAQPTPIDAPWPIYPIAILILLVYTTLTITLVSHSINVSRSHFIFDFQIRNRKEFSPFRQRFVPLIMISGVSNVLVLALTLFRPRLRGISSEAWCYFLSWFANLTYGGIVCPYFLRAYRLYCVFHARGEGINDPRLIEASRKYLALQISTKRIVARFLICMLPFVLLSILPLIQGSFLQGFMSERECWANGEVSIVHGLFWTLLDVAIVCISCTFVYLLRQVWDDFSIAEELISVTLVCSYQTRKLLEQSAIA